MLTAGTSNYLGATVLINRPSLSVSAKININFTALYPSAVALTGVNLVLYCITLLISAPFLHCNSPHYY
jgi:hypothetical protein